LFCARPVSLGAKGGNWTIPRLSRDHDRTAFDCAHAALYDWLKQRAGQFDHRDLARTYVAVRGEEGAVLGNFAILSHLVHRAVLPEDQVKGLPRIDVPVVLLGRLAIDRDVQGQGLGSRLLIDEMRRAERLAEQLGIRAIEVDAIDDAIDNAARKFYEKFGFVPLLDNPQHLFLPMSVIRKLVIPG
jgi:GNAT superfamily N-acetyltransferase